MSQDITSILLPSARVDIYAQDEQTMATADKLAADWRFSRVAMQVFPAGIDAAILAYSQNPSPELIIIETNDISDLFIQQLGALASICASGTDAVIIGPMNDVHLYRNLVGMGVRDYLVRPVSDMDMTSVIAKSLVEKRGLSGARLVTVIGAKGGVGCTSMSQTIAWEIAEALGQKTMLMDAAGSSGTLGVALGLEQGSSLTEAVRIGNEGSDDDLRRIMQDVTEHLQAMTFGAEPLLTDTPGPDAIEVLINRVMQKHPVVVVDLSGAAPSVQKRLLSLASGVVVVTTPLLPALRNARTLMAELKNLRGGLKEVRLIINMQGIAGAEEVPQKDIDALLDMEAIARIPYAPKIFAGAESSGKPVGGNRGAAEIMKSVLPLAAWLSGKEIKASGGDDHSGGKEGALSFLKKLGKK